MKRIIDLIERGLIPDILVRIGIRRLNQIRLYNESKGGPASQLHAKMDFIKMFGRENSK